MPATTARLFSRRLCSRRHSANSANSSTYPTSPRTTRIKTTTQNNTPCLAVVLAAACQTHRVVCVDGVPLVRAREKVRATLHRLPSFTFHLSPFIQRAKQPPQLPLELPGEQREDSLFVWGARYSTHTTPPQTSMRVCRTPIVS